MRSPNAYFIPKGKNTYIFLQATYFVIKHRAGFYLVDKNVKQYYKLHIIITWHHTMMSKLMILNKNMIFLDEITHIADVVYSIHCK